MIELDQQQERCLRDVSQIINTFHGPVVAMKFLRRTRWIIRAGLSIHRFLFPKHFKQWNDARITHYRREARP